MHMTVNQSFLTLINDPPGSKEILWLFDTESPSSCDMMEVKPDGLINSCDPIKIFIFQGKRSVFTQWYGNSQE